jgi:hypothetical protein
MHESKEFNLDEKRLVDKDEYYLYYMKQNELKKLREFYSQDDKIFCPVLKKWIKIEESVVDHKHKLKLQESDLGAGHVRAILEYRVNAMAGKIENMYKRYGFHKENISLPELLRNIADYLESEPIKFKKDNKNVYLIHPNEVPKRKKISKRDLNLLKKYYFYFYPRKKKFPKFIYENEETQRLLKEIKSWDKDKKKEADKFIKNLKKGYR